MNDAEKTAQARVLIQEGLCIEEKPAPCGIVIFGASGDLTARKLLPALSHLHDESLLPKGFYVVGVARSPLTDEALRAKAGNLQNVFYVRGGYDKPKTYEALRKKLEELDRKHQTGGNIIFYLAVPPSLYAEIPRRLAEAGLLDGVGGKGCARVVIEKPFGRDGASAKALDEQLSRILREDQTYRIDHYLGKDTVQNILIFRFANSIFEPVWNRDYIDHVQISVLESLGVESRAGYYDESGVLRDMFQNHMTQLLALTAMEAPTSFTADPLRSEKVKVFRSLKALDPKALADRVVLGQYEGYLNEKGVAADSATPTYAAMRLEIDNWRWKGVPFYLRSGKKLAKRVAEIAVTFRSVPHCIIPGLAPSDLASNVLVFRIQPDEGISLRFEAKKPGPKLCIGALTMDFDYEEVFGEHPPGAYHRLLLDCMLGDQTLFIRNDAVQETWNFFDPLIASKQLKSHAYAPGSWGPTEAERLLHGGHAWREPG